MTRVIAAVAIGLALATVAISLTMAATREPATRPAAQQAATFTLTGTLDLHGHTSRLMDGSTGCAGGGGYRDIHDGTTVEVLNPAGTLVGLGELHGSRYIDHLHCRLSLTVTDLKTGDGPYRVQVGRRGAVAVTESDARAGRVALTLGGTP